MGKFMAQMDQRIKKLEAENHELGQEMGNVKAERWQLLDDNMEKDIKLQEMEEQGQEYMACSKEEKERCRAEVELIWVQYEEEFRGPRYAWTRCVWRPCSRLILHFKDRSTKGERASIS